MQETQEQLLRDVIHELNKTEEKLNGSFVVEQGVIIFRRWDDNVSVSMVDVISGLA